MSIKNIEFSMSLEEALLEVVKHVRPEEANMMQGRGTA